MLWIPFSEVGDAKGRRPLRPALHVHLKIMSIAYGTWTPALSNGMLHGRKTAQARTSHMRPEAMKATVPAREHEELNKITLP
jgi:hypothetical protein